MAKKKKSKASLGFFFWSAFILLIVLLFFVNKGNISSALEKTNAKSFLSKIDNKDDKTEKNKTEKEIVEKLEKINNEVKEIKKEADKKIKPVSPVKENTTQKEAIKKENNNVTKRVKKENDEIPPQVKKTETLIAEPQKEIKREHENKQTPRNKPETRSAVLYFVSIDGDGKITRQQTKRNLVKSDSPMTDSINALLEGPDVQESKKGLRSLIPADTKLISAYVKNGIATINLSEEFQFNRYGIEGYTTQLAQIVFTVSVFPTVTSVQFLIEGQKKEYLGAEGVWIGSPLSTSSF